MDGGRIAAVALALAAAGGAAGCTATALPVTMAPARARELPQPLRAEILAVLDFEDARPAFERSREAIDELPAGGRSFALDRFWSFHSDDAGLAEDPAAPPDLRGRVTGDGAWLWYPFPNHGWGRPLPAPLAQGLADYVALHLEQRRIFAQVIRARTPEEAARHGATLLLAGRVDRFGAMLAELRDPFVARPDDWQEFRMLAAADYSVALAPGDGSPALLERRCAVREDQSRLTDSLDRFRGSQRQPLWQLDAEDFPAMAEHDLAQRLRRALAAATIDLVAAVEESLGAGPSELRAEAPAEPPEEPQEEPPEDSDPDESS